MSQASGFSLNCEEKRVSEKETQAGWSWFDEPGSWRFELVCAKSAQNRQQRL
jgi:hypothetical protein